MAPRWRALAIYAAASAAMQFEWLRFAPLTDAVAEQYGVSAGDVGWLSLVFPLLFLPLALPSGALVDRLSVRTSLRISIVVMLLGAALRLLVPDFSGLLASQALIALVQPLLMSLVSRLVLTWFPPEKQLDATGFATMALFGGLGLAFVLVPMLEPQHIAGGLWIDATALAVLTAAALLALPPDPVIARPVVEADTPSWFRAVGTLLKTAPFAAILLLIFLANGYFNAVFTWLEPLLKPQGIDASHAGLIGLLVLVGGVASMAAIGKLGSSPATVRRVVIGASLAGLPLTVLLLAGIPFVALCVVALVLGALMLGPLPLLIELVATTAGPRLSGTAVSAFWLAGNAGAAAVIASLSPIADSGNWTLGGVLLGGLLVVEAVLATVLLRPLGQPTLSTTTEQQKYSNVQTRRTICVKCGTHFSGASKSTPLGFRHFTCTSCTKAIIYPLPLKVRYFYLVWLALAVIFGLFFLSQGLVVYPSLIGFVVTFALVKDLFVRNKVAKTMLKYPSPQTSGVTARTGVDTDRL